MANTVSTEEFMGGGATPSVQQPMIVSTEDFMGGGGGFAQEPTAAPTGMPSKEVAPIASAPGKEPSLTGVQKAMQALYTPLATVVNTGVGLVSWSAGLAGGLWAYADKLASNLGKGDADMGSVRAARDVTRQMIQEAIPRMQNTIEGQGAEAGLNMIPSLLKNLSIAIAHKTLPATWFEEGAAKAGRKVSTTEKVINDMSDEAADVLSAYMMFHGAGAAAHGIGEMKGKGPSMEPGSTAWYANKESREYMKRSEELGARFAKGEKVSGDMLDAFIKAHEVQKSKIGMPLITTQEFMGGGTEGAPPFRGETLGLGDTGGDKIPPRPVIEPQTQGGALPQDQRLAPGTGDSMPPAPESPTGPPGEPGAFGMTQAARPTGFTPMPEERVTPATAAASGEGTGARGTEPSPAAPPEEGGIPPTAPSIVPEMKLGRQLRGKKPGLYTAIYDPESGKVYIGTSHLDAIEKAGGYRRDMKDGWVSVPDGKWIDVPEDYKGHGPKGEPLPEGLPRSEEFKATIAAAKEKVKGKEAPVIDKQAQMDKDLAQLEKEFAPKKEAPVPKAAPGPKPTIAIQLDDGTKLMKAGAESPEEVAIANGVGPSRIRQVGEVTPEGAFKFDTTKSYQGKMAPELLDELLDVTKEKKKASKGRTKGLLQTALDSIDNQRGSTNITTKAADAIIKMATRAGRDIEGFMRHLKFSDEDIVAVMQVAKSATQGEKKFSEMTGEEFGKKLYSEEGIPADIHDAAKTAIRTRLASDPVYQKALADKDMKASRRIAAQVMQEEIHKAAVLEEGGAPHTISPETVIKHAGANLEVATNAMKDAITKPITGDSAASKQVAAMQKEGRVVDRYSAGSKVLPDQQKPLIPGEKPPDPTKDIQRWTIVQSPSKWLGRAFSLIAHPVIDGFESLMAMATNTKEVSKWVKDVLDPIPDVSKEVATTMKATMDKHREVIERDNLQKDQLEVALQRESKMAKDSPLQKEAALEAYQLQAQIKVNRPQVERAYADAWGTITALAKKHADVRVYLDASRELPAGIEVSPSEHTAALKLREYLDRSSQTMSEQGIPVRGQGSYMPRVWSALMKDEGTNKIANTFVKVPDLLKFMAREDNTLPWFPSAHGAMKAYIPTAEYKMAWQPFLNRWQPFIETTKNPVLKEGLQRWITENLYRKAPGNIEKILNATVSAEYMRLIGLSLSVGFKHLLKLGNTFAEYGPITTTRAAMQFAKVPVQSMMEKFGLKGEHAELKAFRTYVNMEQMVRMTDEIPIMGAVKYRLKAIMGNPVTAVEMFDNGVSVLGGILKGVGKGLDPVIIHRQIMDTILAANFRSSLDQPLWQKTTTARALSMFQSTPFKLAEYKLKLVEGAIKDIASGFKSEAGKDAFGTHYTTKLVRWLMLVGTAEAIAQANDTSVVEMFFHAPFVSHIVEGVEGGGIGFGKPEAATESPVAQLGSQLKHNTLTPEGLAKTAASHFKDLGPATKVERINEGNIPEGYDSAGKYLMGLRRLGYSYRDKKVKGIY